MPGHTRFLKPDRMLNLKPDTLIIGALPPLIDYIRDSTTDHRLPLALRSVVLKGSNLPSFKRLGSGFHRPKCGDVGAGSGSVASSREGLSKGSRSRDHGAQCGKILTSCRRLIAHGALGGDSGRWLGILAGRSGKVADRGSPVGPRSGRLVRAIPPRHLYYPTRRQLSPAFALLVEALRFRGRSASRLGAAARQ